MLIQLKNKDTLIVDEFKFKCCIGKNGINKQKIEGDKSTPVGCLLYTSPSPRDGLLSRMPSSA